MALNGFPNLGNPGFVNFCSLFARGSERLPARPGAAQAMIVPKKTAVFQYGMRRYRRYLRNDPDGVRITRVFTAVPAL